jgi:hypothetical protein
MVRKIFFHVAAFAKKVFIYLSRINQAMLTINEDRNNSPEFLRIGTLQKHYARVYFCGFGHKKLNTYV